MEDLQLANVQKVLQQNMVSAAWSADEAMRGRKVELYRRYSDGDFDSNMTREMREALRLKKGREFGANHCDTVIQTMADRLTVTTIQGDNDAASQWITDILDWNRIDGFQMDVHEATIRDADGYVMVSWDNEDQMPIWTHELAYDGIEGMIIVQKRSDRKELAAAIKIWHITKQRYADTTRVNIYYPDRIQRLINNGDGRGYVPYKEDGEADVLDWTMPDGTPIGVPIVHFANRKRGKSGHGLSELDGVVPLQDLLNRTMHSMAMTSDLMGFPVRWAIGYKPDSRVVPGTMIAVAPPKSDDGKQTVPDENQIEHLKVIRFGQYDTAELDPLLKAYSMVRNELYATSRTPDNDELAKDASGEARKQAEIGLLGKVKRFMVKAGNSWEDCVMLSHRLQTAYGAVKPPALRRCRTVWESAEIRDDKIVVENAVAVKDSVGLKEFLRMIAPVYGYDEERINQIIEERQVEQESIADQIMRRSPMFSGEA
jgi:hypothetical protein